LFNLAFSVCRMLQWNIALESERRNLALDQLVGSEENNVANDTTRVL